MRKSIQILVFLLSFFIITCSEKSNTIKIPPGYSKLKVILSDSSNFQPASIWIKDNNDNTYKLHLDYDSTIKGRLYMIDSLKNENYNIIINSILNSKTSIPFTLIKDSTVFVSNKGLTDFHATNSAQSILDKFNQVDTLCISYYSSGCFHNNSAKLLIYRKASRFMVDFSTDTSRNETPKMFSVSKEFPLSLADSIKKLVSYCDSGYLEQLKLKKIHERMQKEDSINGLSLSLYWISTTFSEIYFSVGTHFFNLTNYGINEIPYYFEFMSFLDLTTKKSRS